LPVVQLADFREHSADCAIKPLADFREGTVLTSLTDGIIQPRSLAP
jgi:hypothetical protein